MAFDTLSHNLVEGRRRRFDWPNDQDELGPPSELDIHIALDEHRDFLKTLNRDVELVVGGPPCQGFSMAGRRKADDSRNDLMHRYIEFIQIVEPDFLIVENVHGMAIDFGSNVQAGSKTTEEISPTSHAGQLIAMLEQEAGYRVFPNIIRSLDLGIPQRRPRLIMIGIRSDIAANIEDNNNIDLKSILRYRSDWFQSKRMEFLRSKGLDTKPVSVAEAIDDLSALSVAKAKGKRRLINWKSQLIEHNKEQDFDDTSKGIFFQIDYEPPARSKLSNYANQLRIDFSGTPNSLRLANHRHETEENFQKILTMARQLGRRGVSLSLKEREEFGVSGTKKNTLVVLDPKQPSHTITTLPDDILHYSEPRILTVRENARIQSFPDWFAFRGKYTTGGHLRGKECPRYTQVGNAVPPFLSEFLGTLVHELRHLHKDSTCDMPQIKRKPANARKGSRRKSPSSSRP